MIAAGYDPVRYLNGYPRRYRMLHIKDFVAGSKISISPAPDLRPKGTELGRDILTTVSRGKLKQAAKARE